MKQKIIVTIFALFLFGVINHSVAGQDVEYLSDLQLQSQGNSSNVELSLSKLLSLIEAEYSVSFVYEDQYIEGKVVSGSSLDSESLAEDLGKLLVDSGFTYTKKGTRTYVLHPINLSDNITEISTEDTVTGRVTDAGTGESLPGVNVMVEGTDIGTVTDLDGNYELNIPSTDVRLAFSYIGYQRLVIDVDGRDVIDVQLMEDIAILDDIVVIGYGTQRREDITTAVSTISSDMISTRSARNLSSSLQGMAPGVTVTDVGGEPGAANLNIRIRGVTTLGNTNPLFIVDGVEQSINDINPNDIESITILEDATSTAIYGSRAANGVVVIETKRGSTGQIQVNYEGRVDFQNLATVPEHLETEAHMRLQNLGFENQGSSPRFSEEDIQNTISGENPLEYPLPNTWFDTVIQDNAPMTRNSLSISGGGDILRTYASVNHFDQQGIYPNRDAQNYQINVNNDIYLLDNLTLSADLRYSQNTRTSTNQFFYHFR